VASEAERLRQLVERLLVLATVEQRRELHERRPVPLKHTLEELLTSRAPAIARKNLRIDDRLPADAAFLGEPFLIVQTIGNLLDNALGFTPARGVVTLDAEPTSGGWRLTVSNSGGGIPGLCPRAPVRALLFPAAPGHRSQKHRPGIGVRQRGRATARRLHQRGRSEGAGRRGCRSGHPTHAARRQLNVSDMVGSSVPATPNRRSR